MQTLIEAYETSRTRLQQRIHELDHALLDDTLLHGDRDDLKKRRELLRYESWELLHIITDLKSRCA